MPKNPQGNKFKRSPTREKIHEIIFEADTPYGKLFDVVLLILIAASVLIVMLESVDYINIKYREIFFALEWVFTVIFTLEYLLRLYSVYRPMRYATSFFGIVDLLAILPAYISLFITASAQSLLVIRAFRLIRVFRIFKLGHFLNEGNTLLRALRASQVKISVFLMFVTLLVIIIGSVMYLVEGGEGSAFSSIPRSIYWAIVTLTTVGYGDITPATELGQFLSAVVMILGYAIIAVPTGIVSAEMVRDSRMEVSTQACRFCGAEGHASDADYCRKCGELLNEP
ncbi:ion transporter [Flavilitoribacter nigricans]|uniref:Ion transporter n=1 Tax=Flavilitoribacter nigricans (strain ATCC 23147 / DSM 23189 / NBRC 102662 / NCIMB 1420 / SS-2) TaxID=1122177 RepID=A0A2D0N384_FLAN2|nr:ion transporter [Flavilitoribacter nigricans]PHN02846.1 ion transporter [Flavilitoribacter nigricans DSM 23189 = NBRC 102662]